MQTVRAVEIDWCQPMKSKMSHDDIEFLRKLIRHGSVKWPGRAECLRLARKKVLIRRNKYGKPIYKFHWKCAACEQWTNDIKDMEVDHIVEIGSFNGDWNEYLAKHFPRPVKDCLQALCISCHMKKTKAFNSARTLWERKK